MSTDRNLKLIQNASEKGFFIRTYIVLTCDSAVNVSRVHGRVQSGGHDVPVEKIISRYDPMTIHPSINILSDIFSDMAFPLVTQNWPTRIPSGYILYQTIRLALYKLLPISINYRKFYFTLKQPRF